MNTETLRILILENIAADADLAVRELQRAGLHFDFTIVNNKDAFKEALQSYAPSLIISDYALPSFDGLQALRMTLEHDSSLPFILWTGSINEQTAIDCMNAGAADYVLKDHVTRLPVAIKSALKKRAASLEQVRMTHLLSESEQRFQRLADNAMDIIYRYHFNPDYFEYVNPACTKVCGYTPEDHYADPLLAFKLIHPEDVPKLQEAIAAKLSPKEPLTVRWIKKDGTIIWTEQHFVHIFDDEGTLIAVEGITRDITDRKHSEEHLKRRNKITTALFNASLAFRNADSLDKMLPVFLEEALTMFNTTAGAICMYDDVKNKLCFTNAHGCFQSLEKTEIDPEEDIFGQAFYSHQPYIANQSTQEQQFFIASIGIDLPTNNTVVCYPFHTATETAGLLLLLIPSEQLSESEKNLLASLTEMAGSAIHRINLFAKTVSRLKQLQSLHAIDQAISARLDMKLVLNIVLDNVLSQLTVDEARIYLFSPYLKSLSCVAAKGFSPGSPKQLHVKLGEQTAGRAAMEREVIIASTDSMHCVCVPLITNSQIKGVMEVYMEHPYHQDDEWLNFLEIIAGQAAIAINNAQLLDELQQANTELNVAYDATIEGWAHALDLRDSETEGHSRRVTEMMIELAKAMGISGDALNHMRRGSLLHDIGKMGIPDAILLKPARLDHAEKKIMQEHPRLARQLLARIDYLVPAIDIPMHHHERWDGTGYPDKLSGDEIPIEARIFAIVDVFDALTSDRPYRPAWPKETALHYIKDQSGKHFDPQVVKLFFQIFFSSEK